LLLSSFKARKRQKNKREKKNLEKKTISSKHPGGQIVDK